MDTIPVNSHPRLDWLRSIRGARSVPAHVVRQISGLIGVEYAQAFVKGAGLEVVDKVNAALVSWLGDEKSQGVLNRPSFGLPPMMVQERSGKPATTKPTGAGS